MISGGNGNDVTSDKDSVDGLQCGFCADTLSGNAGADMLSGSQDVDELSRSGGGGSIDG